MPIYPTHKVIFAHIPKTGGSTVTTLLKNDKVFTRRKAVMDQRGEGASNIFQMKKALGDESDDYFSFAFVRNPWDRFVSAYHYVSQRRPEITEVSCHRDFNSFLSAFSNNHKEILRIRYFRPQWKYVCDQDGEICADFIGRFEQFTADLTFVVNKIDLERQVVRNRKRSKRDDYRSYYDSFGCELVGKIYSRDVSKFGYSFEDGQIRSRTPTFNRLR